MKTDKNSIRAVPESGKHAELTRTIIGVFYDVHGELGHGFVESVYKEAMRLALTEIGMQVETELPISVHFRGCCVGNFRADLIVNNCVLLELKAIDALEHCHEAQILHYLKATTFEVGLLLNFGPSAKVRRFVMDNSRKAFVKQSVSSVKSAVSSMPIAERRIP